METLILAQGFLEGMAVRLDNWAEQSKTGGWSTHQVEANRNAADDCRRMAATISAAQTGGGTQPAVTTFIAEHLQMLVRLTATLDAPDRGVLIANLNTVGDRCDSVTEAAVYGALIGWAARAKQTEHFIPPLAGAEAASRAAESLLHYFRIAIEPGHDIRVTDDMVGEIRSIVADIIQAARGQ